MSHAHHSDDLSRAIAALTVQAVWGRVPGLPAVPREGNTLVKSPFRDERNKSFSICFKGSGWRDHATGEKGGVWDFAKRATGKEGKELADQLIEWSGIVRSRPAVAGPMAGSSSPVNGTGEADFKPSRRAKPKPYPSAATKALLAEQRARALRSPVVVREVAAWSAVVEARWRQGSADTWDQVAALAAARGWSEGWVLQVHELDLLAYPLLPWCDTRRGREDEISVAFKVEAPLLTAAGEFKGMRELGYHQRFIIRGEKSWVYVPYLPQEDRCRSEFQRQLRAECGEAFPGIPGLPFVLPGGAECTHLIITEGQWDAITFAGACGWLDSDTAWPAGWWVMGVRGNNGADTLLAYWEPWLRRWKPRVLLLADNDKASLAWDNARMAGESAPWVGEWEPGVVPSFKEKLEALGCAAVVVRRVDRNIVMPVTPLPAAAGPGFVPGSRAETRAKDFNDYWKAKRPTPEAMAKWLAGVFQ